MSQFVFKLPDLGEGTVEAEIVGWRVKPGDRVSEDDVIVEVMTDKAAVEVPSPVSGRVVSTTGTPGDMVPVGSPLIVFETEEAGAGATVQGGAAGQAGSGAAVQGGAAGQAGSGAAVQGGAAGQAGSGAAVQGGAAGQTGSGAAVQGGAAGQAGAAQARAAPETGAQPARSQARQPSGSQQAGDATAGNGAGSPGARQANVAPFATAASSGPSGSGNGVSVGRANGHARRVATSPAIRRRAHEAGVDLTQVPGSGPNGRIVRKDFDAYVQQHARAADVRRSAPDKPTLVRARPAEVGVPGTGAADVEEIKVIGLRRLIAQRMSEAKRNIPHFAYVEEMDVTELETLRRHLNSKLAPGTPALTYLPFLALALVRVLKDFPQANALYDSERGVIIRHRAVHVGIATQTPEGLKVPVVRDAQARSLWDLAAEMRRVSEAARTNKATREELTGSTITITSLGKLGGIASTPIINAPEVAIIGVNRAVERPVVLNGAITIRRMMNLSSSFDHRFVDGYDAAALVQALKERIEHPATIFIDT